MKIPEIQEEMMKHHYGPAFGFVKLQLEVPRAMDAVIALAMKWTKVLKTGGIDVKFMGVDINTVMFTMQRGQDLVELIYNKDTHKILKKFLNDLLIFDAYELRVGDQTFRRPGDPPVELLAERLRREENKHNDASAIPKDDGHTKEQL